MGNRVEAVRHYRDFLTMIDRPPAPMQSSINDAKARLARLTGDHLRSR
jgi:hypothetical protein